LANIYLRVNILAMHIVAVNMSTLSNRLRALLTGMALSACVAISAAPAQANCAGFGRPPEIANAEVQQRLTPLLDSTDEFFGQKVLAQITENRIILTPAFERFTGPDKQQILSTLQLNGSTYEVYAADGRLVSAQYDGCTRTVLLTERDRYSWYLTRPPAPMPFAMLSDALRNAGQPVWRTVRQSIHPEDERRARHNFWRAVGYDKANRGWWIAWVPEGGYFEITVSRAGDLDLVNPYLTSVSNQYRYVVIASDGTNLADTKAAHSNPWQWVLGETAAPPGWQVEPCPGEAPFLCVIKNGELIGTVELQRWDVAQMPILQAQFRDLGLTPGLLTFANPEDTAKVLR
jgi:hypothetical protein